MPGERWTKKERKSLARQLAHDHRELEDVSIPGRSYYSIRSQAGRMKLIERRAPRYHWPTRQLELLKQLKSEGFTPKQIYEFELLGDPPRSRWAITKQWGRLKLSDRDRARKMQKKKVWQPGERRRFDQFLRRNSRTMTPEQIAKEWNVARSTVARRQTELGVKATRAEVMQMDYSQAKQRKARNKLRRENLRNWARRREEREQRLVELAEELREPGRKLLEQTCSDCGRSWPKRREFFHTRDKKISIGTSRYYKHRCILCENARRREAERRKRRRGSRS